MINENSESGVTKTIRSFDGECCLGQPRVIKNKPIGMKSIELTCNKRQYSYQVTRTTARQSRNKRSEFEISIPVILSNNFFFSG